MRIVSLEECLKDIKIIKRIRVYISDLYHFNIIQMKLKKYSH